MSRYRIFPVATVEYGQSRYAVREGGPGGRLIGESFNLDRSDAETLRDELQRAYEAGCEEGVEA